MSNLSLSLPVAAHHLILTGPGEADDAHAELMLCEICIRIPISHWHSLHTRYIHTNTGYRSVVDVMCFPGCHTAHGSKGETVYYNWLNNAFVEVFQFQI